MRNTSLPFPPHVNESEVVGLTMLPSFRVGPPRIAESPVASECKFMQEIRLGAFSLVLGRVFTMHIRDEAVIDATRPFIDTAKLDLVGRMEGVLYTGTRDKFEAPNAEQARALLDRYRG